MEKYKINECLGKLTMKEFKIIILTIPKIIGKSKNTFANYCKIQINSKQDVPHEVVAKLEKLFDLPAGGLLNSPVRVFPTKE